MQYVLLLRGINVGGKNKVNMEALRQQLTGLGFSNVASYINSGNLIFDAEAGLDVSAALRRMLEETYDFAIPFALIPGTEFIRAVEALPDWWHRDLARRDVLFFTEGVPRELAEERVGRMKLHDELVHFSHIALFWGKIHQEEYLKTAYHRQLGAEAFYKKVTIRNGNTVEKLARMLTST